MTSALFNGEIISKGEVLYPGRASKLLRAALGEPCDQCDC